MKPDRAIGIANNSSSYRSEWPYSDYHAGSRVWTRGKLINEGEFRTHLDSGQVLAVRFSMPDSVFYRHCSVSVKLDQVFLGWFTDTKAIPSVAARRAVEYLLATLTPTAKRVISQAELKFKEDVQTMRARSAARSREAAAREKTDRDEAIRKADGR